jgi:cytochrome P450
VKTDVLGRDLPQWFRELEHLETFDEIDEVLRSPKFVQGQHRQSLMFLGDTILLIDGDAHFARRRMESELFDRTALQYYESYALRPTIDRMMSALQFRDTPPVCRADLVDITRTALYRISASVTGIDGVDEAESTKTFIDWVNLLGEASTVQWSTRPRDEVIAEGLEVRRRFFERFLGPSIERRRELLSAFAAGTIGKDVLPRDVMMTLLLKTDGTFDPEILVREATLYLIASTRTTLHAVPHTFQHVHEWATKQGSLMRDLNNPAFLRAASAEALRLHPPSPALVRQARQDVTLRSGRRFAAGQFVGLLFGPGNRDSAAFGPDANEFNPARSLPERVKGWGLSFGGGEHLCIGRSLVTGLGSAKPEESTSGTVVSILTELLKRDARPDPDLQPQRIATSLYDAFVTFPIVMHPPA